MYNDQVIMGTLSGPVDLNNVEKTELLAWDGFPYSALTLLRLV